MKKQSDGTVDLCRRVYEELPGRPSFILVQRHGFCHDYPFVARRVPKPGPARLLADAPDKIRVLPVKEGFPVFYIEEVDSENSLLSFCFPSFNAWDCQLPLPREDFPKDPVPRPMLEEFVEKARRRAHRNTGQE